MKKLRSKLGSRMFKLASEMYEPDNALRREVGDMMFTLAAMISPNKK